MQNKFDEDYEFGDVSALDATEEEDNMFGIDKWFGSLPVAHRRYRANLDDYNRQISIRYWRSSGVPTEYHKILNGELQSLIYIYEFVDAFVICKMRDIKKKLERKEFHIAYNTDGTTAGAYLTLDKISHFIIAKDPDLEDSWEKEEIQNAQEVKDIERISRRKEAK